VKNLTRPDGGAVRSSVPNVLCIPPFLPPEYGDRGRPHKAFRLSEPFLSAPLMDKNHHSIIFIFTFSPGEKVWLKIIDVPPRSYHALTWSNPSLVYFLYSCAAVRILGVIGYTRDRDLHTCLPIGLILPWQNCALGHVRSIQRICLTTSLADFCIFCLLCNSSLT